MNPISNVRTLIFAAVLGLLALPFNVTAQTLLAGTNKGELVEIDIGAGTATLVGDAGGEYGWSDLAMDGTGNLWAVSRQSSEESSTAHLYTINPATGAVISHIGDVEFPYMAGIDFGSNGALYANWWTDDNDGGLARINTATAELTPAQNLKFGTNPFYDDYYLSMGGIAQHPNGGLWAVEAGYSDAPTIFPVNASTGLAGTVVRIGLNGEPTALGADNLEILSDGRFVVLGALDSTDSVPELFFVDPIPDSGSGLAELTPIPMEISSAIAGKLNGLTSPTNYVDGGGESSPIPTMSITGLVTLIIILLMFGVMLIYRRGIRE